MRGKLDNINKRKLCAHKSLSCNSLQAQDEAQYFGWHRCKYFLQRHGEVRLKFMMSELPF